MANHQLVRAIFPNLLLCLTINFVFWPITVAIHSSFAVQMDAGRCYMVFFSCFFFLLRLLFHIEMSAVTSYVQERFECSANALLLRASFDMSYGVDQIFIARVEILTAFTSLSPPARLAELYFRFAEKLSALSWIQWEKHRWRETMEREREVAEREMEQPTEKMTSSKIKSHALSFSLWTFSSLVLCSGRRMSFTLTFGLAILCMFAVMVLVPRFERSSFIIKNKLLLLLLLFRSNVRKKNLWNGRAESGSGRIERWKREKLQKMCSTSNYVRMSRFECTTCTTMLSAIVQCRSEILVCNGDNGRQQQELEMRIFIWSMFLSCSLSLALTCMASWQVHNEPTDNGELLETENRRTEKAFPGTKINFKWKRTLGKFVDDRWYRWKMEY